MFYYPKNSFSLDDFNKSIDRYKNGEISAEEVLSNSAQKVDIGDNFFENLVNPTSSNQKFNAQESQKQRDFEEYMSNTAYQRAVEDMKRAGLNPYLVYSAGGTSGASTPSGASASNTGGSTSNLIGNAVMLASALLRATKAPATINKYYFK